MATAVKPITLEELLQLRETEPPSEYIDGQINQKPMPQGVLYYVVYNPTRRRKPRLEVYKLVNGEYQLQDSNPVWLPEVNLAIGMETGTYQSITREWLYWYNHQGKRLLTPEEQAKQAQQRAEILAERLRVLGVDPDSIA